MNTKKEPLPPDPNQDASIELFDAIQSSKAKPPKHNESFNSQSIEFIGIKWSKHGLILAILLSIFIGIGLLVV